MGEVNELPSSCHGQPHEIKRSSDAVVQDLEHLTKLAATFKYKAFVYGKAEKYWRRVAFVIAMILGILPVIAGSSHMLPDHINLWFGFGISVLNVMIVVIQMKCDMGERIADASMARKGYESVCNQIDFFTCDALTHGNYAGVDQLLQLAKSVIENVESNMSYPNVQFAEKPKPWKPMKAQPASFSKIIPAGDDFDQIGVQCENVKGRSNGDAMGA